MPDIVLNINEARSKITFYEENDMWFSAALLWEKIVALEPDDGKKLKYANALRLCGFFLKAEDVYLQVDVHVMPPDRQYLYHLYLGQLYIDMKDFAGAKKALIACMEYERCDTVPFVFLASILSPHTDNAEAIYYLKVALDKEGDIDEVYYNLANRLAVKGDFEGALEAINNCLAINIDYGNATQLRADIVNYLSSRHVLIV